MKTKMSTGNLDHTHYKCRSLLQAATGARDMLKEAAKEFRLNNDKGHAAMCELHVEQLNKFM